MDQILNSYESEKFINVIKNFYKERQYINAYNAIVLFINMTQKDETNEKLFSLKYACKNKYAIGKKISFPEMTNLDMLKLLSQYFLFKAYESTTYKEFIAKEILYTIDQVYKTLLLDIEPLFIF
jgi:hypothetical protein